MHKEHACPIKLATKLVYSLRRVTNEKEPRETCVLRLALAVNYTGEAKGEGSVSPVKAEYNTFLSSIDNELEADPSISFQQAWDRVYEGAKVQTEHHKDFNTNINFWTDRAYNNGLKGPYDRLNNGMPGLFLGINETTESVAQCIREQNNILENYRRTTFPNHPPLDSRTSGGAVDFKEYPDILVDSINDGCFSKLLSDPRLIINQTEESPPKEDRSTVISRLVNVLDSVWDTFYGDFAKTITEEQITTIIESAEEKIKRLEDLPALPPNNNDNDNNNNNGNNGNNNSLPWGEGYIPGNSRTFAATLVPNNSRRYLLPLTFEQARTRASLLPPQAPPLDSPFTFTGPGLVAKEHGLSLPGILKPIKKIPTAFAGSTTPPFSPMVVNRRALPVSPMGLQGGKTRRYRARRQTRRLRKSRGTMKRKQRKTRRQK